MLTKKGNQRNITSCVLPRKYNVAAAKSASDNVDTTKLVKCLCCDGQHQLWHCNLFKEFDLEKRTKVMKEYRLCFDCLRAGHAVAHCHRRHNTLLHRDVSNVGAPSKESFPSEPKETASVNIASNQ